MTDTFESLLREALDAIKKCGQYIPMEQETDRDNRNVLNNLLSRIDALLASQTMDEIKPVAWIVSYKGLPPVHLSSIDGWEVEVVVSDPKESDND